MRQKARRNFSACSLTAASHEIRHILIVERDILHRPMGESRVDVLSRSR